jgi:hypothetical protein
MVPEYNYMKKLIYSIFSGRAVRNVDIDGSACLQALGLINKNEVAPTA